MAFHWAARQWTVWEWWHPSTSCTASWSGLKCCCSAWASPIWWQAASCFYSAPASEWLSQTWPACPPCGPSLHLLLPSGLQAWAWGHAPDGLPFRLRLEGEPRQEGDTGLLPEAWGSNTCIIAGFTVCCQRVQSKESPSREAAGTKVNNCAQLWICTLSWHSCLYHLWLDKLHCCF